MVEFSNKHNFTGINFHEQPKNEVDKVSTHKTVNLKVIFSNKVIAKADASFVGSLVYWIPVKEPSLYYTVCPYWDI